MHFASFVGQSNFVEFYHSLFYKLRSLFMTQNIGTGLFLSHLLPGRSVSTDPDHSVLDSNLLEYPWLKKVLENWKKKKTAAFHLC